MLLIIAGILCVVIWLYLLLAHGGFWRVRRNFRPASSSTGSRRIAVVVPARNEAEFIERSIASLLNQSGPHSIRIFLVDDGSTDSTAEIATRTAAEAGKPEMLTVIEGRPLPAGWSGKLWAVEQGIERAREFSPNFFLLTDADIVHNSESVSSLAALAEAGDYDLASYMVRLHCGTLAERFLIPAFVFFFFKIYPPAWIANPRRRTAGAAGGAILARPEALDRAGGIAAIRGEIIDDCALARQVKRSGGKIWLGLTDSAASIRPYGSFREIGRMISRAAFNQLHHSTLLLFLALFGMVITYLAPPLLIFAGNSVLVLLGAGACLLMTLSYIPLIRFYGLNLLWAPFLPLVAIFYMGATLHSAVRYWSGRGGQWKGRFQDRA